MNEEQISGINPNLVIGKGGLDEHRLNMMYQGEGYRIFGPTEGFGIILGESSAVIKQLLETRQAFAQTLQYNHIESWKSVSTILDDQHPPQILTTIPPANYINLANHHQKDAIFQAVTSTKLFREDIAPEDFWVDPETNAIFLIALEKLNGGRGRT